MAVVAATGFFDGVHLGHRLVIKTLCSEAEKRGAESLVVTFWPHPRMVLQNDARELRLLNSLEEKIGMLKQLGVDRVEVLDFTRDFARMSTREYMELLRRQFGVSSILLGYDNTIGSDLLTPGKAAEVAANLGIEAICSEKLDEGEVPISSTRIRRALRSCEVVSARAMLGYDYSLRGVVVSGKRLGRTLGYPTANLKLYDPLKEIPGNGVYLTRIEVQGQQYWGMTNIGVRPTVGENGSLSIETNIFDFDEQIYGLDMKVSFVERVRPEQRFSSTAELSAQLGRDKAACREIISGIQKK